MVIETTYAVSWWWVLTPNMEAGDFILLIISIFVLVASIFSIVFILWWGVLLILSGWKDDKIKPAINTIRYAVIWIIVTVFTIFVFPILWRLLWLDVEQYAEPRAIFQKIEEIWNQVFWRSSSSTYYPSNGGSLDLPVDFSDL